MAIIELSGISAPEADSGIVLEIVCALFGENKTKLSSYGYLSLEGESTTTGMVGKY